MDKYLPEECFTLQEGANLFLPTIFQMIKNSIYSQDIFEADTWQPSNEKNFSLVLSLIEKLVYQNSRIENIQHIGKIQSLAAEGKSCIIMPEHYSNFDLPAFYYLIQTQAEHLLSFSKTIISLAASKLNEESKVVLAFSEAFNRIMIYPARAKKDNADSMSNEALEKEKQLAIINQRAIKTLLKARDDGNPILMFPSGTRYRPEKPESRNALEQAASFLKRFDYVCFMGIAGNTLIVNPNDNMAEDVIRKDSMVYWVDEPMLSKDFMNKVEGGASNKQGVADYITKHLLSLHEKAENIREKLITETPPEYLGPITSPQGIAKFMKEHNISPELLKTIMG